MLQITIPLYNTHFGEQTDFFVGKHFTLSTSFHYRLFYVESAYVSFPICFIQ